MTKNTPTAPPGPANADTAEPVTFPQHAVPVPEKPLTIVDILMTAEDLPPAQTMALIIAASTISLAWR